MKHQGIIFILLFCFRITHCQNSNVGNWFMYFGNQKISNSFNLHNEIQYRSFNIVDDVQQLILRTGIGYNLTENNNNLLLGYGFIHSQNYINKDTKVNTDEHRVFQQFITKQQFNRIYLQHRYRFEERFFTNNFHPSYIQLRSRYFLGLNIPLNKPSMDGNVFYLSAYNEVFLNMQQSIFDRNRAYVALGCVIKKDLRVELGMMAQSTQNNNRNQFQIAVFNNLNFFNQ